MTDSFDDMHLVMRSKKGDRAAFEQIVIRYQDRIYNLCRHIIGDTEEAQDAAQDVFVKAYKNLHAYRLDAAFYTWLYRITVNTCLDYGKKLRPEPFEEERIIEQVPSDQPSPEQLCQSKETGRMIDHALQRLPAKLRAAIVLKEIEGLSYEEIADTLDTSVGTIKSRISRAREELRRLLRKKI